MNLSDVKEQCTGVLKNWELKEYGPYEWVVTGNVFDDKEGRFHDGKTIRTSLLVEVNFQNKWCRTLNSTYYLSDEKYEQKMDDF